MNHFTFLDHYEGTLREKWGIIVYGNWYLYHEQGLKQGQYKYRFADDSGAITCKTS